MSQLISIAGRVGSHRCFRTTSKYPKQQPVVILDIRNGDVYHLNDQLLSTSVCYVSGLLTRQGREEGSFPLLNVICDFAGPRIDGKRKAVDMPGERLRLLPHASLALFNHLLACLKLPRCLEGQLLLPIMLRPIILLGIAGLAAALPQGSPSSAASSVITGSATTGVGGNAGSSSSSASTTSASTAVPSSTASPSTPLQNYTLPEIQYWCNGRNVSGARIYCPGEVLQTVQLAQLYPDSKTFVDKPTIAPEEEVLNAFYTQVKPNGTIEALIDWVEQYFGGEGLDIQPTNLTDFVDDPDFLQYVEDPIFQGWLKIVHSYWKDLVRVNVKNESCVDCVSSLIEQPYPFIVPGT